MWLSCFSLIQTGLIQRIRFNFQKNLDRNIQAPLERSTVFKKLIWFFDSLLQE